MTTYRERWEKLTIKKNFEGKKAIEAVKQNGYALQYVKDQSEAVCIEAVKRNGDALRYVLEWLLDRLDELAKLVE